VKAVKWDPGGFLVQQVQAEGGVDEEFEVLLVPLVLVGSLDLLVAGACPALMDLRDPKVRTETGVSLDHPDPKEREVTSADLVLPVYRAFVASRAAGECVVEAVLLGLGVNPVRTAKLARLDLRDFRAEREILGHQGTRGQ